MTDTIIELSDTENPITYTGTLITSHLSNLQNWCILNTQEEGELLFIDNQLQSSKNDEYIYHESFVHSLMIGCYKPKKVLILGGGEGCVIREVLKWPTIESVTQVDWDASLVSYFKGYGSSWNADSYKDPRVKVVISDALLWLQSNTDRFDCIFIDLLDPQDNMLTDYFIELIKACRNHLSENGSLTLNAGSAKKQGFSLPKEIAKIFSDSLHLFQAIQVNVPSFKEEWVFLQVTSRLWNYFLHTTTLPSDLRYFSKETLINSLQWSERFLELKDFWKQKS